MAENFQTLNLLLLCNCVHGKTKEAILVSWVTCIGFKAPASLNIGLNDENSPWT
jgi:hypothetical protein